MNADAMIEALKDNFPGRADYNETFQIITQSLEEVINAYKGFQGQSGSNSLDDFQIASVNAVEFLRKNLPNICLAGLENPMVFGKQVHSLGLPFDHLMIGIVGIISLTIDIHPAKRELISSTKTAICAALDILQHVSTFAYSFEKEDSNEVLLLAEHFVKCAEDLMTKINDSDKYVALGGC